MGGTITDYLEADKDGDPTTADEVYSIADRVPGLALHFGGSYKAFSLVTEYVTALDSFAATEVAFSASGAEPSAWNSELAYTTALLDKETVFALGYQKSWEAVALELPENRYIAATSMNVFEAPPSLLSIILTRITPSVTGYRRRRLRVHHPLDLRVLILTHALRKMPDLSRSFSPSSSTEEGIPNAVINVPAVGLCCRLNDQQGGSTRK